ncbi:MAG: T9SS type A sorting domain-containing protein [Aequorivita sp.]|uniref:T9SS type A sorting domain-containing protein n=1 Tax=Aequorivita marina TaxID=3073654 RepID=UPI0028754F9E|nr:T9SS type A sorting domain-containing protein [Aequorivita sp. S2608]MDS1299689.1 T9SS type A sorting domain-containing protein [Aequorivita sp. S2608]
MLLAQNNPEPFIGCGAILAPEDYKLDKYFGDNQKLVNLLIENNVNIDKNYLDQLNNMESIPFMNSEMFNQRSTHYKIPIKAWIYRYNNGTGNISQNQVYQIVDELNSIYSSNTNISFYLLCDIEEINNTNYANQGDVYFDNYVVANKVSGALNIHFVINSYLWTGRGQFPWFPNPYTAAVVTNDSGAVGSILAHEIGHNLGLLHTFESARSSEHFNESAGNCFQEAVDRGKRQGVFCVSTINRLKCEINGDGLCDTEADPGIIRPGRWPESYLYPNSCNYNTSVGGQDNWNDNWTPTVANIMAYVPSYCRSYFSPLQVGKMYGYIGGIGINNPTFDISGPDALCYNQTATYSVNTLPGANNYFWELPSNMTIVPGAGTIGNPVGQGHPVIKVKAANGAGGEIKVTPNCGSKPAIANILDLGAIEIDGYDQACPIYTYTYTAPFISTADYSWTITNGIILSDPTLREVQIKMTANPSNQSTLHLEVTNVCNYTINSYKTIIHGDPPPPAQQCISYKPTATAPEALPKQKIPLTEFGDMLLYPNPASTEVTIIAPTRGRFILSIFNTIGQLMYGESIEIKDKQTINVNALPDGVYYVKLEGETGTSTKKLILKK